MGISLPAPALIDGHMLRARIALQAVAVTLDGRPAALVGAAIEHAGVRAAGTAHLVRFAWAEAARVVREEGGRFVTPASQRPGGTGRVDGYNGSPAK